MTLEQEGDYEDESADCKDTLEQEGDSEDESAASCKPRPEAQRLVLLRSSFRERVLYWQPTGPNPLYHRDD